MDDLIKNEALREAAEKLIEGRLKGVVSDDMLQEGEQLLGLSGKKAAGESGEDGGLLAQGESLLGLGGRRNVKESDDDDAKTREPDAADKDSNEGKSPDTDDTSSDQ